MTRARIGEILLRRGALDAAALHAAWEQKVIYGDRLGTNLLATGLLAEEPLALALGEQHGVHAAYGSVLSVSSRAVKMVPGPFALKRLVLPHHVQGGVLWLLMVDPGDVDAIREVKIGTGHKQVTPVVVAEARMWSLLAQHHGVGLSLRPVPLDRPFVGARAEAPAPSGPAGEDLVSEDEFQRLYAGVFTNPASQPEPTPYAPPPFDDATMDHRLPLPAPPAAAATAAPVPLDDALEPPGAPGGTTLPLFQARTTDVFVVEQQLDDAPAAQPPRRAHFEAATPPSAPPPEASTWGDEASAGMKAFAHETTAPGDRPLTLPESAVIHSSELPVDVADDEGPLSFAEALAALEGVVDRTGIGRIVLRYARARAARAALLTVHPHHFVGWEGIGEGLETTRLRQILLDRAEPSVFSLVLQSKAPYIGPLQKLRGNGAWVKATGKKIPKSVVVLPVLVKGNAINLLYLDGGHDAHVDADIGELTILAQRIAGSYEQLLAKA